MAEFNFSKESCIDNKEVTMQNAIEKLLNGSKYFDNATSYFRLSGLTLIEEALYKFFENSEDAKIRLLLSYHYDTKYEETRRLFHIAYTPQEDGEVYEFSEKFYNDLLKWINEGRILVKIFVDDKYLKTHEKSDIEFMHSKTYLFSRDNIEPLQGSVLLGSSNLTNGGLVKNRELNIYSQDTYPSIHNWYEDVWKHYSEDYSEDLIADLQKQMESEAAKVKVDAPTYTPIEYFYWNLAKAYGEPRDLSLEQRISQIESQLPYPKDINGNKFFAHQKVGIRTIYKKLMKFDTQVLSDGVGLGKTLEAAALIKLYLQDLESQQDGRKILILRNNRLKQQWTDELQNVKLSMNKIDFITRQKFAFIDDETLKNYANTYALIVIDEAHEGFLRQSNQAYQRVKELIRLSRDVNAYEIRGLLLTATPWNNSREDVIRLGLLFANRDKIPLDREYQNYVANKLESSLFDLKGNGNFNKKAYLHFWQDYYIQRTRQSLKNEKYLSGKYPIRIFPLETGEIPYKIKYSRDVSEALKTVLARMIELHLPYQDTIYQYFGENKSSNIILRQRQQLLRRADSSNAAFSKSIGNIEQRLKRFLSEIMTLNDKSVSEVKNYFISLVDKEHADLLKNEGNSFEELFDIDNTDLNDLSNAKQQRIKLINEKLNISTINKILSTIIKDISEDLTNLDEITSTWRIVSKFDEKQKVIIKQVKDILKNRRKVLIFSEFQDTAWDYFDQMRHDPELNELGIGIVSGGYCKVGFEDSYKEKVLSQFSPSSQSTELFEEKEISILIGTDAISSGQNLQDSSDVITIELPYNPQRLEQRIGRIDRPKLEENSEIYVYAYPSDEIISAEITLTEKYQAKAHGASEDTEGEINLPFVNAVKNKGIVYALNESEGENVIPDDLSQTTSVSDDDAKVRLYTYFKQNKDKFTNIEKVKFYPNAFSENEINIFIADIDFCEINGRQVKLETNQLFNQVGRISIADAENISRIEYENHYSISESIANKKLNKFVEIQNKVLTELVNQENERIDNVHVLDSPISYISDLSLSLKNNREQYISEFETQQIDKPMFAKIVKSLINRGFTGEQKQFLHNLTTNGYLDNGKVYQNVWRNLHRFVTLFAIESETIVNETTLMDRINLEKTSLNIISAIL